MCIIAKSSLVGFFCGWFLDLLDIHEHSGGLQLALLSIGEKQASCKSLQNYLVMLSIDLATFVVSIFRALLGLGWDYLEV